MAELTLRSTASTKMALKSHGTYQGSSTKRGTGFASTTKMVNLFTEPNATPKANQDLLLEDLIIQIKRNKQNV